MNKEIHGYIIKKLHKTEYIYKFRIYLFRQVVLIDKFITTNQL